MNTPNSWPIRGIVALVALLLFVPLASHADTFQIYNLGSDEAVFFYGMTSTGTVVLDKPGDPVCGFDTCYLTFINGLKTATSSTAPIFTADNGSACAPSVPSPYSSIKAVCNNGFTAWDGYSSPSISHPSLYDGTNPPIALGDGSGIFLFINSVGDVVWNDPVKENWYEAIDLGPNVVPEPSSLLLLSTGLAAAFLYTRRRSVA
jgi:hypothetical protein